jgi:hypothetical protein
MAHQQNQNPSVTIHILKNARYAIMHHAKKMIKRWYRDQGQCKGLWGQDMARTNNEKDFPEQRNLLMDECRILYRDQRSLDELDQSLYCHESATLWPRPMGNGHCGFAVQDHDLDGEYITPWVEGIISRGGCFMRYRGG